MWYVLAFLLMLALAQAFFLSMQTGNEISYSEFKTLVREGRVAEVTVAADSVRGKLKGDASGRETFSAVRIEDPKLVEELAQHGVKHTGEIQSRWVDALLAWGLPLLLFIALWTFLFRRMSGAEGGVMSFARSRAKIYAEDDVKVKFGDFEQVTRSRSVSEWLEDQTRAKVRRSIERLAQIEDDLGRG